MKTTNINEVIKEIKEYQDMQEALKVEIEKLKAEAIEYLNENEIDEYLCDEGKVTYREVLSNRFASTKYTLTCTKHFSRKHQATDLLVTNQSIHIRWWGGCSTTYTIKECEVMKHE